MAFEPPQKKFKAGGLTAEVRFDNPENAMQALQLNGSNLGGSFIGVELDTNSKDSSKIIVTNVPSGCEWQEVKDHFKTCGTVAFANVKGGKGGNGPAVATIRYETPEEAAQAIAMLNGSSFQGNSIEVKQHPGSSDKTKLQVFGVPPGSEWQELKDFFGTAGKVIFADIGSSPAGGVVGEVRYDDASHAQMAMERLNGSMLGGAEIKILADQTSKDGTKLIVTGIPAGIEWQELKDHFKPFGTVAFCNVKPIKGKGKGGGGKGILPMFQMKGQQMYINPNALDKVQWGGNNTYGGGFGNAGKGKGMGKLAGEVRYDNPLCCQLAIATLNGSILNGGPITVDWDYSSQDGSKLIVTGVPTGTGWQDLKDHFAHVGQVAFANLNGGAGQATFKGGKGFRKGDWICPACQNHNFASKTECRRCFAPAP